MESLFQTNDCTDSEIMRPAFDFANIGFGRNTGLFCQFGLSPTLAFPQERHSFPYFLLFLKGFIHANLTGLSLLKFGFIGTSVAPVRYTISSDLYEHGNNTENLNRSSAILL